ncbi:hypothetical protein [Luteimonas sp. FCS-9]|uniref:hypothetical protein n=1 Tax=Luteimonas sp. FCS-9 TaxID=1547516 RepID=UPI000A55DF55|nr:hypothetical protein [Luteimonas sp. FCS-9]
MYALLAREARTGVVFRRGPSRQVQLIRWDLREDRFEHGQWFKGRIYERRCDLSPSGRLLVYFAATNRGPYGSWTALSKPPFLTALALWPKGDAWGGGGVFEDERTLLLNHRVGGARDETALAPGFQPPQSLRVRPLGRDAGHGEDAPIDGALRQRDGWRPLDPGEGIARGPSRTALYRFTRPQLTEKTGRDGRRLQALLHTVGGRNTAWYGLDHRVLDHAGQWLVDLPGSDWADWDDGDLVFAQDGCLYRLRERDLAGGAGAARLLHDFRSARFAPLAPTAEAMTF